MRCEKLAEQLLKRDDEIAELVIVIEKQAGRIKMLESAINETLNLADFLNEVAANGAGFVEHWGERVLQAVEALRNVDAFADQTLEHNRVLLEHNSKLVEECQEQAKRIKALEGLMRDMIGQLYSETYEIRTFPGQEPFTIKQARAALEGK